LFTKINFNNNIKIADIWSVRYTINFCRKVRERDDIWKTRKGNEGIFNTLFWKPLNQLTQNGMNIE